MKRSTIVLLVLTQYGVVASAGDRVTVCHRQRSITVNEHALPAHLAHGDYAGACSACLVPPPGMVSWWPGDEDATDIQGPNDGNMRGGTLLGPGMVGSAFSLDGIDDYVEVSHDPSLMPSTAISLDAWFRTTVTGSSILYKHGAGGDRSYGLQIVADQADFFVVSGGVTRNHLGTSIVTDGNWHHAVGVFDGVAGRHELYVDGVLENGTSPSYASIDPSTVSIWIGAGAGTTSSAPNAAFFLGEIDEVELFDRALSATEALDIFLAGDKGKCKQ